VIGERPEDFYGNSKFICDESEATGAPGGESFFRVFAKKIVGAVPVKSEGAVMEITGIFKKGCSGNSPPQHLHLSNFYY